MFSQISKQCFPPSEASAREFRISGMIFLLAAVILESGGFLLAIVLHQPQLLPPLFLLPMIIWLVGTHRILWGGRLAESRWLNAGRIALTAVAGYVSLVIFSGLVGTVVALVKKNI